MKLKRLVPVLCVSSCLLSSVAFANTDIFGKSVEPVAKVITPATDHEGIVKMEGPAVTKYTMDVPVLHLNNPEATAKANAFIEKEAHEYLSKFVKNPFNLAGAFTYEIKFENDNLISLVITTYNYNGGAHGMQNQLGLVIDKNTGENIPLSYYLDLKSNERVIAGLKDYDLALYSQSMERIDYNPDFKNVGAAVPNSYYLAGDGGIYVIYPPYALASYNYGCTRVYFSGYAVNKFNHK